jgi:hypothetical protein
MHPLPRSPDTCESMLSIHYPHVPLLTSAITGSGLVIRALSVPNLYYAGFRAWGQRFPNQLGEVAEAYLGRQLRLLAGRDLLGEIVYSRRGRNQSKSVDWIWITPRAVFLFESKSARLSAGAKAGGDAINTDTTRYLEKARGQLDETARLIAERHPAFSHIPTDRPVLGIAVMSESFYLGNSFLTEYGAPSSIPSIVASLRDIEHLVCYPIDIAASHLAKVIQDPEQRTWSLGSTFKKLGPAERNPILEAAWQKLDFEVDRTSRIASPA